MQSGAVLADEAFVDPLLGLVAQIVVDARDYDDQLVAGAEWGIDANHAKACGTLYLHGKQQPLCLDVRFNQSQREPLPPFHDKAGFSATATLERSAFGIDDWKTLVGDRVELRIEAEAIRDDAVLPALQARAP